MRRLTLFAFALFLIGSDKSSTAPSGSGVVLYQVTGTAKHAALTYENSTGGTDQKGTTLPFSYTWSTAKSGDFLYISAQIDRALIRAASL
jgi:hypothetical protein